MTRERNGILALVLVAVIAIGMSIDMAWQRVPAPEPVGTLAGER